MPFKQKYLATWKPAQGLPDIETTNEFKLDSKYCNVFIRYKKLMESELVKKVSWESNNPPIWIVKLTLVHRSINHWVFNLLI